MLAIRTPWATALLILLALSGCVSPGIRLTALSQTEFLFTGTLVDESSHEPLVGRRIELATWNQPALSIRSHRKLGEVVTDQDGSFSFSTKELEIAVQIEGAVPYNAFGSDPFDPRVPHVFYVAERPHPARWGGDGLRLVRAARISNQEN